MTKKHPLLKRIHAWWEGYSLEEDFQGTANDISVLIQSSEHTKDTDVNTADVAENSAASIRAGILDTTLRDKPTVYNRAGDPLWTPERV